MRKILFFLAVAVATNLAQAAFVEESSARKVAESWFNHRSPAEAQGRKIVKSFVTANQNLPVFYTYGFENGGFVIVSADDAAEPIIGYSYTSPISEKVDHPAVKSWLDNYSSQVKEIADRKADNSTTLPKWKKILENDFSGYKSGKAVEPLVKTKWDQGSPYDMYVPTVPNSTEKCAVGCVATAMAQVMNYYQWPITGQGSNSYTPSITGQTISANFGATTYEWAKTLDNQVSSSAPQGVKHAVALLSSHCGISVDMMYGGAAQGGSGAYSEDALTALKSNFKYKPTATLKNRTAYTQAVWDAMLKAELDLNRPLYYAGSGSGGGHAFVCDGYQDADSKFHFNWGWSGSYDGYFASNALNPDGVGTGGGTGGFNSYQKAFFNLWDYSTKPQKVQGLSIQDFGNGTQLKIKWNKSHETNFLKYQVYIGTESYTHTTTSNTTDTVFTVSNLTPGTKYYIGVTALDTENDESKLSEGSYTPQVAPTTPVAVTAVPELNSVKIIWNRNGEIDIAGYNIYKSVNNTDFTKVNTTLYTDSAYTVPSPPHTSYSYYKVSAVDNSGHESALSTSIPARPVTLDQGVLIIDESTDGTGTVNNPNDVMQDQFYDAITANVTNKINFDAITAGTVSLSELGPYSTIIWHNQTVELNSIFSQNQADIKKYLDFGGKMLILADKPGKLIEGNNSYPIDYPANSIAQSYFGIDSAFYKSAGRSNGATPFAAGYSQLTVDTAKALESYENHIKKIETLSAASGAAVIYKYNSGYDITNNYGTEKGKPSGLQKITSGYKTVTLALPMYYIKQDEAKTFIDHVLNNLLDINEEQGSLMKNISLLQNYPNPFNPATTIKFFNPAATNVKIAVYNAKGELVNELFNGVAAAGMQSVKFDATGLNSGVYFYRLTSEKQNLTGKMLLVK